MDTYNVVFQMYPGVTITIPMKLESKHYSEDAVEASAEHLATQLGGAYLYKELQEPAE
jgi:hypothetical protein